MSLSLEKMLAVAVLEGDEASVNALVDRLLEMRKDGMRQLLPVMRTIDVSAGDLKIVAYTHPNLGGDVDISPDFSDRVRDWLMGDTLVLPLVGFDRLEMYRIIR